MTMKALYVSSNLSYLVNTRRYCLILRKLHSTMYRCLYNSLSYFHGLLRLLFGGTTGRIPHFLAFLRHLSPSYASSMINGLPWRIFLETFGINFWPSGSSDAEPGDKWCTMGRSTSATIVWIFVVRPPRLMPIDCVPFFWAHPCHQDAPWYKYYLMQVP
jgi:hypothetical protein